MYGTSHINNKIRPDLVGFFLQKTRLFVDRMMILKEKHLWTWRQWDHQCCCSEMSPQNSDTQVFIEKVDTGDPTFPNMAGEIPRWKFGRRESGRLKKKGLLGGTRGGGEAAAGEGSLCEGDVSTVVEGSSGLVYGKSQSRTDDNWGYDLFQETSIEQDWNMFFFPD